MSLAVDIVVSILTSGTVGAVVVFLIQQSIRHAAELNVERYKAKLKADNDAALETLKNDLKHASDTEIERLRAGLRQAGDAYAARVGKLYERRLDVIADAYALLPKLQSAIERYVNPVRVYLGVDPKQADEQLRKDLGESYGAYHDFFAKNRLFFDAAALAKIDDFDKAVNDLLNNFRREGQNEEQRKAWERAHEKAAKVLPELMEELRKDFARLLGVEE